MSLKDFQILSKLGEGTYSSVWRVKRLSDGQEYAMKKVKLPALSEKEKLNSLNEVRLLASLDSPYIVEFKEVFLEDNQTLCIIMEFAGGGDIQGLIAKHQKMRSYLKEKDIWRFSLQMVLGLKALHDRKILHRDLKCANVFVSKDEKTAKLGDLNVSKVAKDKLVYTQTGTPYYASPEVWRDEPYDTKSDIWSLGCVIYELCALKPPFRAQDMSELFKKVQKGVYDKISPQFSPDLNTLLSLCLQVSPQKRPSCDQLLSHPVIKRNCQGLLYNLDEPEEQNNLLQTIRLPKNVKNLQGLGLQLPKANYKKQTKSVGLHTDYPYKLPDLKDLKGYNAKEQSLNTTDGDRDRYDQKTLLQRSSAKKGDEELEMESSLELHQNYIARLQKGGQPVQLKGLKSADVVRQNEKHILDGSSVTESNAQRRGKHVIDNYHQRETKSIEPVRYQKEYSRQQQQYDQKSKASDGKRNLDDRRQNMPRKAYLEDGDVMNLKDNIDKTARNRPKGQISPIKNSNKMIEAEYEKLKAYEDRMGAMDRRAQQIIQKYQIQNKDDSVRKISVDPKLRRESGQSGAYGKQEPDPRAAKIERPDAFKDALVKKNNPQQNYHDMRQKEDESKRKVQEESAFEMERIKKHSNNMHGKGVARPVWWG